MICLDTIFHTRWHNSSLIISTKKKRKVNRDFAWQLPCSSILYKNVKAPYIDVAPTYEVRTVATSVLIRKNNKLKFSFLVEDFY